MGKSFMSMYVQSQVESEQLYATFHYKTGNKHKYCICPPLNTQKIRMEWYTSWFDPEIVKYPAL
jgi:hypothetical protein